jgi:hypothetical protein
VKASYRATCAHRLDDVRERLASAPDSTDSAPAYSASAWRMIDRTSGASSSNASRTLNVTRPGSDYC